MKKAFHIVLFAGSASILFGCATAELKEGKSVSLNSAEISKDCTEVGEVYGQGGGALGGTISDQDLLRYSVNDMRNNAAKLGATHVLQHGNQLGGGIWGSTKAQVTGTAYKCPSK